MNRSCRTLSIGAFGILALLFGLWSGQALALDSDVDDEVITVPFPTPDLLAAWSRPSPPDGGASAERDSMTTVPGNAAQRSRRES